MFHNHLDSDAEITVGLYLQSVTLWILPPLDHSLLLPTTEHHLPPYFAFASDQTVFPPWRPGRDAGVSKGTGDAVIAPRSHILLEAYIRIHALGQGKRVGSFGIAMIAYMQLYVGADEYLDMDLVPEPLKTSYRELWEGKKPVRQWMLELKAAHGTAEEGPESDQTQSE